jgi:hypothetical protein
MTPTDRDWTIAAVIAAALFSVQIVTESRLGPAAHLHLR